MKPQEWNAVWRKRETPQSREKFLRKVMEQVENGDVVLDMGCGQGHTIHSLLELFPRIFITGIDFSLEAIKKAVCLDNRANFVLCDARFLPFRNCVLDIAYSEEVLEHVPEVASLLLETYRVLKRDGAFLASVPNKLSLFYIVWRRTLDLKNRWIYGDDRPYTPWGLKDILKLYGFVPFAEFFFEMPHFLSFLDFYRNPLCVHVAIIARKNR